MTEERRGHLFIHSTINLYAHVVSSRALCRYHRRDVKKFIDEIIINPFSKRMEGSRRIPYFFNSIRSKAILVAPPFDQIPREFVPLFRSFQVASLQDQDVPEESRQGSLPELSRGVAHVQAGTVVEQLSKRIDVSSSLNQSLILRLHLALVWNNLRDSHGLASNVTGFA